jgi:transposase
VVEEIKKAEPQKALPEKRPLKRRQYSAEEKMRIVIAGLRGPANVAELCRGEGINQNLYYRWHNEFLDAGKRRLAGETSRETANHELKELRAATQQLKQLLGELMLENQRLKKKTFGQGE